MIKVLIADDERLVRIGIRSSLQWEDYGFTVVGEACNGEDALLKIQQLHPDLLLTDIRMPKMDGIQLLQEIEHLGLMLETIIMSCYNEFDLVRAAMKYGASDYLLKLSLSDEELLEVLERSRKRILRRREYTQLTHAGQSESALREKFSQLVMDTQAHQSELMELLQSVSNGPMDNPAFLLVSADRLFDPALMSCSPLDRKTVSLMSAFLHDILISRRQGDAFLLNQSEGLFLISLHTGVSPEKTAELIQQKMIEFFHLTFSVCCIDCDTFRNYEFSCIPQTIIQLQNQAFLAGRGCVFAFCAPSSTLSQAANISVAGILGEVRSVNILNRLSESLSRLSRIMSEKQLTRSVSLSLFTELYYKIADMLHTYRGSIDELNQSCEINLLQSLQQLQFLEDAGTWFKLYVQKINNYLSVCESRWTRNDILLAINYINNNYHLPISSQKVARLVGISDAYFSTLFKKETGSSFSEYVTGLRINKAKLLLEDRNIYIYEVGEYVGYADANYFGKVFKKHTGLSPEAYRQKMLLLP